MEESLGSMRLLMDLALASGRKRKSLQTGYLHYCYHLSPNETHLPIPIVENFLFALALLRSRIIENINEAKVLLEGLLHFQNRDEEDAAKGNFPIYLHDFPACKDGFTGAKVACAIYWILKQFHHVIGGDLKKRLEESLLLAINHSLFFQTEKNLPYHMNVKIASTAAAVGQLLEDRELKEYGLQMLEVLRSNPDEWYWYCPSALGSMISSLLMVYPKLSESPWKTLWEHLEGTWHRKTASYAGPTLKESQDGYEPEVTLYDLFCGYFAGVFSDRALKESVIHLEAALIPVSNERFKDLSYPLDFQGVVHGAKWFLRHEQHFAYSYIDKVRVQSNSAIEKDFHPYRLIWGNQHRTHTFVCQGNAKSMTFDPTHVIFEIEGFVEVEDREKNREIIFFIDAHETLEFLIEGQKSSTFLLGEKVFLKDEYLSVTLTFNLEEGEGRFLGHRMLGNRPSQLANKGESRFNAFDWQIFLRTINRSDKCLFKVELNIEEL